jgi:opacity protein-like surface antigen
VFTAEEYEATKQAEEAKKQADEASIQARIDQGVAEGIEKARESARANGVRNLLIGETYQLDETSQLSAVSRPIPDSGKVANVNVQAARTAGKFPDKFLLFSLDITGPNSTQVFQVTSVEVFDSRTMTPLSSEVLRIETEEGEGKLPVSVTAEQQVQLYVATRLKDNVRIPPLLIVIRQPAALPAFSMNIDEWEKDPVLRDIKQREDARKAAEERRTRDLALSKRTWIGAYGLGGVIWLEDGLPMTETTDATSIKGLGIRISKGLVSMDSGATPLLAVEVDAAFGSSGTARFADVTFNGMQGELQSTATLGRVHAGLALRLGDKLAPVLRAGIGGQGVSENAELITATGSEPGPESSLDVALSVYVGGAAEFRLGESFVAGLAVNLIDSGGRRSLEAGLNLAYALGP